VGDRERVVFVHACVHVLLIVACNTSLSCVYMSVRKDRDGERDVHRGRKSKKQTIYVFACLRACKILVFECDMCVCLYMRCRCLNGHVRQPFYIIHWHNERD
jgi:hypothetical protein